MYLAFCSWLAFFNSGGCWTAAFVARGAAPNKASKTQNRRNVKLSCRSAMAQRFVRSGASSAKASTSDGRK